MKQKRWGMIVGVIALCVVGAAFVMWVGRGWWGARSQKSAAVSKEEVKGFIVTQSIDYDMGMPVEQKKILVTKGESVLSVLKRTNKVITKKYSFGELVDSINGIQAGKDGKYWIYLVNGKEGSVGAGEFAVQLPSSIEWKLKAYEK